MRGAVKILDFKDIHIFVHWTFLLIVGWVILANARWGVNIEPMFWSLLFIGAVFASVALHELGHALTAAHFGIKAKNIVLLPIGGTASIEKFPDNPRQELSISIAGPLVNLVIAILIWLIFSPGTSFWSVPEDTSITHGHDFIYNLKVVNLGLALFNLIPAFPMDGGRILRALLGFKLNYIRATSIASNIGRSIAVIFIGLGIWMVNPFLPLIGLFIILSAGTEEYYLRLRSLVKGIKLNEVLMYNYNSLQANMTVQEAANMLEANHAKYFVLLDGANPVGIINRLEIMKAVAEMKYSELLKNLIQKELLYFEANKDVEGVLEKLASNDERIFPVMQNSHLIGVVNLNHIIEYLLLHRTGTPEFTRIRSLIGLMH
jgi:Zn-dependent protease/predicted transcriptional regulator